MVINNIKISFVPGNMIWRVSEKWILSYSLFAFYDIGSYPLAAIPLPNL